MGRERDFFESESKRRSLLDDCVIPLVDSVCDYFVFSFLSQDNDKFQGEERRNGVIE